jgi:transketolase
MAKGLTWTIDDADHMTQAEIYGEVLTQLGAQDERIIALTADLAGSTKIGRFQKDFPGRFINLGVAEMNMMGMASGLASVGFIPVASTFAVFASLRCAEFVRTDICYQNRNVKIIATHSGTSFGQAGTTHHCTEDLAVMRSFSNMRVIAPADSYETAKALAAAIEAEGPIYMRIGRPSSRPAQVDGFRFRDRKGDPDPRGDGHHRRRLRPSPCSRRSRRPRSPSSRGERARARHAHGEADRRDAVLQAVGETRRIITAEDHNVIGGLGSAVAEVIAASGKGCVLKKLGLQDEFSIVGYPEDLLHRYKLDGDGIAEAIQQVMKMDFEADEDWEDEV